jgi:hypothetical protein
MSRKVRSRRQQGGGNKYTFTVATPISPTSAATGFPAELGTFTAGNQSISFSNPKSIVDIKVMNGATPYGASSFTVSSGTKVSFQVGATQNLVPNGITTVRGSKTLPGAAAAEGMTGPVTIKGLGTGSFGTLPPILTFEVYTSN